jgi:hypothetical protein
LTELKA